MAVANSALSLGEVLVRDGMISPDQLRAAIESQRRTSHSLGRVLVEQDFITEAMRTQVLRKDFGFEAIDLESEKPDPILCVLIPSAFAYKHRILPIRQDEGNTLIVAMEDPSDLMVLDAIKSQTGMKLKAYVAGSSQIAETIANVYASQSASQSAASDGAALSGPGERSPLYKVMSVLLLPILCFSPAVVAVYLVVNNEEIQSTLKDYSMFSVGLYTLIGWSAWTIVVFYINGLIFPPEKKAKEETA